MNIKKKVNSNTRFRKRISYFYILVILIGALLLFSPLATQNNNYISFLDSFFISASAFSDTGLSTVITIDTFNNFGQLVILILIQLGGLGIMSFKIFLLVLVGKKINTRDRLLVYTEHNLNNSSGIVRLVKDIVRIIIIFEIVFTFIICFHMMIFYHYEFINALWFGLFHSVSAINNAGFDLTGNSFMMFNHDYLFQSYIMFLIIIGGLGFPVLLDIKNYFISKKKNELFRFSIFSKISVSTYFIITIISFILICIVDFNNLFKNKDVIEGIFYSLFHVISARNAGFATMDLTHFSQATQMILALLMFIGAAPASTGGGIRTTTFALVFLYLKNNLSDKVDVEAFNRRIPKKTIHAALITFSYAIFLVTIAAFTLVALDPHSRLIQAFFEVCSAFGTTGLTLDFTQELTPISKLVVAIVMVIGQVGIANTLLLFTRHKNDSNDVRVPEENIQIG